MLSHVALLGGDQVGLWAFAEKVKTYVPPSSGARAGQHLIRAAYTK